ncbi:hypothetical protein RHA1_ro08222 (plasmid) [Rhodococcus jostii RHA1]|uniref:Uncharacterized protein n=1 Tax=Rhodococcus jostii (strain RHA1) TaxID=101510 RepID=Q0RZL9_RHOJR|nr:hypothetical protein RHA1_ro08222 [Rhodococcus jostii RHA1]
MANGRSAPARVRVARPRADAHASSNELRGRRTLEKQRTKSRIGHPTKWATASATAVPTASRDPAGNLFSNRTVNCEIWRAFSSAFIPQSQRSPGHHISPSPWPLWAGHPGQRILNADRDRRVHAATGPSTWSTPTGAEPPRAERLRLASRIEARKRVHQGAGRAMIER